MTLVLKNIDLGFRHFKFEKRIKNSLRRKKDNTELGINFYNVEIKSLRKRETDWALDKMSSEFNK